MKKKLAMAAALLPNPDLLFLDEPFEGVDAVTSRVIRDLLAGFVARGLDGLPDLARPGDRRAALHPRRHHRQGGAGRAGVAGRRSARAASLEECFLQKAGADHDGDPQAQLAGGGVVVNWRHLRAFVWLRWRLMANQWRRAGAVQRRADDDRGRRRAGHGGPAVRRQLRRWRCYLIPKAAPAHLMYAWDGLIVAFLFFWGDRPGRPSCSGPTRCRSRSSCTCPSRSTGRS